MAAAHVAARRRRWRHKRAATERARHDGDGMRGCNSVTVMRRERAVARNAVAGCCYARAMRRVGRNNVLQAALTARQACEARGARIQQVTSGIARCEVTARRYRRGR